MTEAIHYDTLPPGTVSDELAPVVAALGLDKACRELREQGWTVLPPGDPDLNARLRATILAIAGRTGGAQMLLARDPVFAAAVLEPRLLAMAEFSVGRGFLLSQVAASVRRKGSPVIGVHADHNWLPAPFPAHNMLLTACWACDDYSRDGGATLILPGTHHHRRHPDAGEVRDLRSAIAIECPAGSIAMWDGNIWHSNWPRTLDGERVVCHITYSRLMMRPVEDYAAHADRLVADHGERMAQLMGRHDGLMKPGGFDYTLLRQTFNNSKR